MLRTMPLHAKCRDWTLIVEEEFETTVGPEHRLKIQKLCMHELGHYVVGRDLGAAPTEITITFTGPGNFLGNTSMSVTRHLATVDEVRQYLEDRICILMGGTLGEHLSVDPTSKAPIDEEGWIQNAKNGYEREISSKSDKNKADELLRVLLFMDGIDESTDHALLDGRLAAISDRIWGKTIAILSKVAPEIYDVGAMMADRVRFLGVKEHMTSAQIEGFFAAERGSGTG